MLFEIISHVVMLTLVGPCSMSNSSSIFSCTILFSSFMIVGQSVTVFTEKHIEVLYSGDYESTMTLTLTLTRSHGWVGTRQNQLIMTNCLRNCMI